MLKRWYSVCLVLLLVGCTSLSEKPHNPQDPFESWNRKTFAFNEAFDRYALKPVATAYRDYTPNLIQAGVSNIFSHLDDVGNMLNGILQLDTKIATNSGLRLLANTVFGLVGVFDIASQMNIKKTPTSLSLTLNHYGIASGNYLVLPFLGSHDVRSALSFAPASIYLNPLSSESLISLHAQTKHYTFALIGLDQVNTRAQLLNVESIIVGDRYTFIRDAYIQQRTVKEQGGVITTDDFYGEDDFKEDGFGNEESFDDATTPKDAYVEEADSF